MKKKINEKKGQKNNPDPDRLSLDKKDILSFCDRVLNKWQKDPMTTNNAKNIAAMLAVKSAIYFTDDESLKAIWAEIIKWIYQLLYENAIAQAKAEKADWASTFDKLQK